MTESEHDLLAWHRAAMAGERPPIHDGDPQCGWFKTRFIREGVWIPARILMDPADPRRHIAYVGFEVHDAYELWAWLAGNPIHESEYKFLMESNAWIRENAPDDPRNNPRKPVDLNKAEIPEF